MIDLFNGRRTVVFSTDRKYRYRLDIVWDENKPAVNYLMANPSKADEISNDPTVERCERRAMCDGFGSLIVTNLFALVSTNPAALRFEKDPIGLENDRHIREAAKQANAVVCAWGTVGCVNDRPEKVLKMMKDAGVNLHALMVGKRAPMHPLYIPYDCKPKVWDGCCNIEEEK